MSEEIKEVEETVEETAEQAEAPAEETAEAAAEEAPAEAAAEEAPAEEKPAKKDDGSWEMSFDELGLTKSLEKMTAKELRAVAMEKIPSITGASGMSKDELVTRIKEIFGLVDEEGGVSPYKDQILRLKAQIRGLREQKEKIETRKDREIMRRKINKLKKRTRRLANAG